MGSGPRPGLHALPESAGAVLVNDVAPSPEREHDAVVVTGRLFGHETALNVMAHPLRLPRQRVAPAAPAGRPDPHGRPRLDRNTIVHARQLAPVSRRILDLERVVAAMHAAVDAPGIDERAVGVGKGLAIPRAP